MTELRALGRRKHKPSRARGAEGGREGRKEEGREAHEIRSQPPAEECTAEQKDAQTGESLNWSTHT